MSNDPCAGYNSLGNLGRRMAMRAGVRSSLGAVAGARNNKAVIGRLDDIKPAKLRPGENSLTKHMEGSLGSPKLDWKRNSGVWSLAARNEEGPSYSRRKH